MWFDIDQKYSIPIYQQLINGVKEAIAKNILVQGDKMPSVRELAGKITINPNTIAKAYQEMEREGILETLRGKGTFVAGKVAETKIEEKKQEIKEIIEKACVEAAYIQMTKEELIELTKEIIENWNTNINE